MSHIPDIQAAIVLKIARTCSNMWRETLQTEVFGGNEFMAQVLDSLREICLRPVPFINSRDYLILDRSLECKEEYDMPIQLFLSTFLGRSDLISN